MEMKMEILRLRILLIETNRFDSLDTRNLLVALG